MENLDGFILIFAQQIDANKNGKIEGIKMSENYGKDHFKNSQKMENKNLLILISFGFICCFPIVFTKKSSNFLRPCYFTNWAQSRSGRAKFEPEDYVPRLCTHIFYAFGSFNSSFIPIPGDPSVDLPNDSDPIGLYGRVNELKKYDPQLKTLLSFGGWTLSTETTLFSEMTANSTSRAIFINSSIAFLRKYNFDGIDFDWEYPDSKENFNSLLKEFDEAAEAEACSSGRLKLLAVAAVSAGISRARNSYDIATIAKYLDFINLMSYDFHGTWESQTGFNSPIYANDSWNIEAAAKFWNEQGMPKSKIIIGIPTYGRGWTLSNPGNETGWGAPASGASKPTEYVRSAGVGAYYEFCEMLANNETVSHFNKTSKVPYLIYEGDQWFSYEDIRSVKEKVNFVKANKYGGAFVWTLDFDDFNGECPNSKLGLYPLIGVIARKLGGIKISQQKPVSAIMGSEGE